MTPERWQKVERIYQEALEQGPSARAAFLDQICAGDTELRGEVASLLEAHKPEDPFLEGTALEVAAHALAAEAPRLAHGKRLGPYELIAPLGAGGMGEVWRAMDSALDRQVAIKVLLSQYSRDPQRLRRFEQEARAAGMLNHPNVLAIYAIGKHEGSPYLVTELLEGATLRQKLADARIPEAKAIEYAIQIAQGLAAAHHKGVVHRDLKPENIFVTNDGHLKILDFGLAKLVQSEPAGQEQTETAPGMILGTPAYMSPEQVRAQFVDQRSDIFSLGAILYEMLAGRRAFAGSTSVETMNAILKEDPPPIAQVSPVVEQILKHCLEKTPEQRFQSARDLGFQLNLARQPSAQTTIPINQARPRYFATVAVAGALIVATAGLTWWLTHWADPKPAPMTTRRLTADSGLTTDPALSPDGKLVAYASDRSGANNLDIWRQQIATGEAIPLTSDPADESEPAFSPDGSRIAFRSERDGGGIYVVSAFGGGEPRLIAKQGRQPRFSPDGAHIAYWTGGWYMGKGFIVRLAGGTPIAIQPDFASVRDPIWSPDGKHLLFLAARNLKDVTTLEGFDWWVMPRDGGPAVKTEATTILRSQRIRERLVAPAGWLDDRVLFSAKLDDLTSLWHLSVSPGTGKASGLPHRLTSGTTLEAKPVGIAGGEIVYASLAQNLNIWSLLIDANRGIPKGEPHQVTHSAYDAHTSLSADGKKLVFISTRSGNPDVWMKDLSTGKETALTATPWIEEQPEITADGSRVCYLAFEGQRPDIYEMNIGGGEPEKLCEDCIRPWDWSPDGKKLLYLLGEGRDNRPQALIALGLVDVATRRKSDYLESPRYGLARPRFSPDGRWISFVAVVRPGFNHIMIAPFETPAPSEDKWNAITDATTLNDKPRWSPDGNLLYFTSDRDAYRCIYARRLDPRTKRAVGEAFPVYHSHSPRRSLINMGFQFLEISLSTDRIFFNLGETTGNIWMAKPEGQK